MASHAVSPRRNAKGDAEEEGLWPVLKWVKRLIDGVLIEDFGEETIEFAPRIYLGRGRANRRRPAGAGADELRRRGDSDALAKRA